MSKALKRRSPNQKRAQQTREKLLAGAITLLNSEGYASLTARRLAQEAGVSVGVLYDYYPSIQALLFWVYEERLKSRLKVFDDTMMGEHLKEPLTQTFPAYLKRMEEEHHWSRIDLELRNAAASDPEFKALIIHFEEELTERYCTLFKAQGSKLSEVALRRIARYSHAIDHASMRLQLEEKKDGKAFFGELTARVNLMLMEHVGVLKMTEANEIAKVIAKGDSVTSFV